jgi:fatty acid desaturase
MEEARTQESEAMARTQKTHQPTPQERQKRLLIHVVIYVLVNSGLTALNLIRRPEQLWFYWPLVGWGLGLALHASIVYHHRAKT